MIILSTNKDRVQKFLDMPKEQQRYFFYSEKIHEKDIYVCSCNVEGKIWFCANNYRLMFSDHLYLRKIKYRGLSFHENKLKVWAGSNIENLFSITYFNEFIKLCGLEWIESFLLHPRAHMLTKTLLEKIFQKKITNPHDLVKWYVKYSLKDKSISPRLLLDVVMKGIDIRDIRRSFKCMENKNHYLEFLLNDLKRSPHLNDLIKQGLILGKKININWSKNRMEHVHNKWTKEIMEKEIDFIENYELNYEKIPSLLPTMTLLTNAKEVFREGRKMSHCIYANYWSRIREKKYIAIHYEDDSEAATIGIRVHGDYCSIDQIQSYYNDSVSSELNKKIRTWFSANEIQFREFARKINYSDCIPINGDGYTITYNGNMAHTAEIECPPLPF